MQYKNSCAILFYSFKEIGIAKLKDTYFSNKMEELKLELDKTHKAAADTNNDGKIDAADYLRIKRHFLGTYDIYKQ